MHKHVWLKTSVFISLSLIKDNECEWKVILEEMSLCTVTYTNSVWLSSRSVLLERQK